MKNTKSKNNSKSLIENQFLNSSEIPDLITLLSTSETETIYNSEITSLDKAFNININHSSIDYSEYVNNASNNGSSIIEEIKSFSMFTIQEEQQSKFKESYNLQTCINQINTQNDDDSIEKILADGLSCKACELYKTRTNFVLGEGPIPCDVVFIGEAPGAEEDATGRPFVGRAGQHLDKILASVGFKREDVYICNILKDRPPNNRTPTLQEMRACSPLLIRQLKLVKPKIIGLLGNTAIKFVIGEDAPGITKIHGKWFRSIFGIPCMPMYHPSFLLRNPSREVGSPNWQMWQDIKAFRKKYEEIKNGLEFII